MVKSPVPLRISNSLPATIGALNPFTVVNAFGELGESMAPVPNCTDVVSTVALDVPFCANVVGDKAESGNAVEPLVPSMWSSVTASMVGTMPSMCSNNAGFTLAPCAYSDIPNMRRRYTGGTCDFSISCGEVCGEISDMQFTRRRPLDRGSALRNVPVGKPMLVVKPHAFFF